MKAREGAGALTGATGAATMRVQVDNKMALPLLQAGGLAGLHCTAFRDATGRGRTPIFDGKGAGYGR